MCGSAVPSGRRAHVESFLGIALSVAVDDDNGHLYEGVGC